MKVYIIIVSAVALRLPACLTGCFRPVEPKMIDVAQIIRNEQPVSSSIPKTTKIATTSTGKPGRIVSVADMMAANPKIAAAQKRMAEKSQQDMARAALSKDSAGGVIEMPKTPAIGDTRAIKSQPSF